MASREEDAREREAKAALERVERDSETLGASAMARAGRRLGDHFSGRDAIGAGEHGETDPIEVWGRRIGRFLSVIAFVAPDPVAARPAQADLTR